MIKYIREPFCTLSHLLGAGLSVIALFSLLEHSHNSQRAAFSCTVFTASLIFLYIASALTHGVRGSQLTLSRIERYDHAAIFALIAGTYTPVCLLIIKGNFGWALLITEWILALIGIYTVFANLNIPNIVRVTIYLAMGWLFIFALGPIVTVLPNDLLAWLLGGALFYSIGSIFFLTNKPNLWDGYFGAHDLWHVFVLGGSTCHYIFIREYLLMNT